VEDSGSELEEDSSSDEDSGADNDEIYKKLLAAQNGQDVQEPTIKEKNIDSLIDKDTRALLRACSNLRLPSEADIAPKKIKFGDKTQIKTLILDMDETMIHSNFFPVTAVDAKTLKYGTVDFDPNGCMEFNVLISKDGQQHTKPEHFIRLNVKVRKHLEEVLQYLSTMYEIAVFTAGEQSYADSILDFIDMDRTIIKHRLYRQHCVSPVRGIFVKDLRVIADRDPKDMVLVDNSIVSFAFNLSNGVPIASFTGQANDEELLFLVTYLEDLFTQPDVRPYIDGTFRLKAMMHELKAEKQKREHKRDIEKAAAS
jgi:CTD small phosphatase-like protein 2